MLTRYFDDMSNKFDVMRINDFFGDTLRSGLFYQPTWHDDARYETTENELILSVDVPGVKPSDIKVDAVDNKLSVLYELRGSKHTRTINIKKEYDLASAKAKLERGVLELRIPKISIEKHKIDIEIVGE